jgi:hypothetical protein
MTRKEAVLLVSRALAVIELVAALDVTTFLPAHFMSFLHYVRASQVPGHTAQVDYLLGYDEVDLMSLLVRIGGFLILAIILWKCGPWVERVLLPKQKETVAEAE